MPAIPAGSRMGRNHWPEQWHVPGGARTPEKRSRETDPALTTRTAVAHRAVPKVQLELRAQLCFQFKIRRFPKISTICSLTHSLYPPVVEKHNWLLGLSPL